MTLDSSATISPDKFFVVCLFHDFWIQTDAVNIVLCSVQRACRIDTFQLSAFFLPIRTASIASVASTVALLKEMSIVFVSLLAHEKTLRANDIRSSKRCSVLITIEISLIVLYTK